MEARVPILLIACVLLVSGCTASTQAPHVNQPPVNSSQQMDDSHGQDDVPASSWKEIGNVVPGAYADADIVDLGSGQFRMYYSLEPEQPGFDGQVYSSLSADGINWTEEPGVRITQVTFPSVIELPEGGYRMYFQRGGAIMSAFSDDGLVWEHENGVRMDTGNDLGLDLDNVASPTVMWDGSRYIMVYAGSIPEPYQEMVPNQEMRLFLWAESDDGLVFDKMGMALDSRNDLFKGWLDGPELVKWDDNTIRLYFWSYKGVYHVEFDGNTFKDPVFDFGPEADPMNEFPPNPPGDPTLAFIENNWFMYYGQHTEGIFAAQMQ